MSLSLTECLSSTSSSILSSTSELEAAAFVRAVEIGVGAFVVLEPKVDAFVVAGVTEERFAGVGLATSDLDAASGRFGAVEAGAAVVLASRSVLVVEEVGLAVPAVVLTDDIFLETPLRPGRVLVSSSFASTLLVSLSAVALVLLEVEEGGRVGGLFSVLPVLDAAVRELVVEDLVGAVAAAEEDFVGAVARDSGLVVVEDLASLSAGVVRSAAGVVVRTRSFLSIV